MSGLVNWVGEALFGGEEGENGQNGDAAAPQIEPTATATNTAGTPVTPTDAAATAPNSEHADESADGPMLTKEEFQAIMTKFSKVVVTPEVAARLKSAFDEGKSLEDEATAVQNEIIVELGHDPVAVQKMFSRVLEVFEEDQEFINKFMDFMEAESNACDLAELGAEGLAAKKAELAKKQTAEMQQEMHGLQKEAMKIKSLQMILKMGAEEQTEMIKVSMQQMRKILAEKPEMKDKVKESLLQRGIPVEDIDDPIELVRVAESKMQGIQDETKAELLEDASKAGVSPEEFLMQQMEALNVRAQEFQKSYSGGFQAPPPGNVGGQGVAPSGGPLRFAMGAKVLCNMGAANGWHGGTIVAQNYREQHWPPGQQAAYQVQLDRGQLIFAPFDRDDIIRSG